MTSTPQSPAAGFRQHLGLFDATMLVAGSMIGSGIFIVSVFIARDVGSAGWLLFVWILTGIMTVIGALSFAELAAMMPNAGGQYVFLREAYGPLPAFLYGWTNFLVIQTGFIAAVGVAFAKFLGIFAPALGTGNILWEAPLEIYLAVPVPWLDKPLEFEREKFTISAGQFVAVAIAVFLTGVNCLGVREGKWVQNVFTVAKIAGLLMLIVVGLTFAARAGAIEANLSDLWSGIFDTDLYKTASKIAPVSAMAIVLVLCGAMVGALFSADAWGNVTFAAAEVKDAKRNLPRSLVLGTGLVILLYIMANVAYVASLPLKGDEIAALKLDRKAKAEEENAANHLATVRHLEGQIAELRIEVLRLKEALARAEATGAADEVRSLKERLNVLEKKLTPAFAEMAKRRSGDMQNDLAQARKLESEAAYQRGIQYAKDDRVATAVLEQVSPTLGVSLMAIAIMISTFGCVNGIVLAGSRLYYAMAQDGLFFQSVGKLNSRGVPAAGLILQGAWSIVLIFSGSYGDLLDYIIFGALLFYVFTVGALFVLRRKRPEWPRPYRAFGYPIVPAVYIGLCAIIMLGLLVIKPLYSWPSFFIILTGIPVYWLWRTKPIGSSKDGRPP